MFYLPSLCRIEFGGGDANLISGSGRKAGCEEGLVNVVDFDKVVDVLQQHSCLHYVAESQPSA